MPLPYPVCQPPCLNELLVLAGKASVPRHLVECVQIKLLNRLGFPETMKHSTVCAESWVALSAR